jgi:hypothetical protein
VTPENLEAFKKLSLPIWDEMAGKLYPKELLDELKGNLAQYRAKAK